MKGSRGFNPAANDETEAKILSRACYSAAHGHIIVSGSPERVREWSEFVLIKTFLDNRRKDFFIIIKNERKFELIIINY